MPFYCALEKAHPTRVILPHFITVICNSPKQEEELIHELAALYGGKPVMENDDDDDGKNNHLTYTENLIFCLLKEGYLCRAISEKLSVDIETVRTHKKNVFKKLGVHSREELLNRFRQRADEGTMPY